MISVLVPVFNVKDYICRSLDSIINQSFKDIEIILVDDGSTDGSGKICDDYNEKDNRIRVFHTENRGVSNARNVCLQNAKGDYILFADADDVLHPFMIDTLWKLINSGDYDFSMCYGKRIFSDEELKAELQKSHSSHECVELTRDSCMKNHYLGGNNVEIQFHVLWNKLYKRELLDNLFYSGTASNDTEYNSRVYQRVDKAILTKDVFYYWIQRPNSITHKGYNIRYANVIHSYLVCLNGIPQDNELYRSYCLRLMYRMMALVRYRTKGNECHEVAVGHCKTLLKETSKEFIHNTYIPMFEKYRLLLFNYCPFSYNLYRKVLEIRNAI